MNNLDSYVQSIRSKLKLFFDTKENNVVNVYNNGYTLSFRIGQSIRYLHNNESNSIEFYNSSLYYYINSELRITEIHLLNDMDILFNLYLIMDEKMFNSIIYIISELEYFKFYENRLYEHRLYNTHNINNYLQGII